MAYKPSPIAWNAFFPPSRPGVFRDRRFTRPVGYTSRGTTGTSTTGALPDQGVHGDILLRNIKLDGVRGRPTNTGHEEDFRNWALRFSPLSALNILPLGSKLPLSLDLAVGWIFV